MCETANTTGTQADGATSTAKNSQHEWLMRPMPGSAIWLGLLGLLAIGGISVWLLIARYGAGTAQDKTQLEIIKLAGSIVVGTGGTAALVLAARRQRATELGLLQQERAAADTKHDADERRISELQASAGEQLGSDKAAVRLNGLYQLERLGQEHPHHRQTVVKVLCSYLRMPFTHPDELAAGSEPDNGSETTSSENTPAKVREAHEELQVRLTAQSILADHLRPTPEESAEHPTENKFWGPMDLNLTGAVLHELDLNGCHVRKADFGRAQFLSDAWFIGTRFHSDAWFDGAQFHNDAWFVRARFHSDAEFVRAQFHNDARFDRAQFHNDAEFVRAQFHNDARFVRAQFHSEPRFDGARCRCDINRSDVWPEGWSVRDADNDEAGRLEGLEGRWGHVVRNDSGSGGGSE